MLQIACENVSLIYVRIFLETHVLDLERDDLILGQGDDMKLDFDLVTSVRNLNLKVAIFWTQGVQGLS